LSKIGPKVLIMCTPTHHVSVPCFALRPNKIKSAVNDIEF